MREILFRGKSKDNYEWIYGGFVSDGFRSAKYIVEHGTFGGLTIFNEREVISETIGQYTGLTDKNGKKIFEGDIVRTQPFSDRPFSQRAKYKQHIGVVEYRVNHFKNSLYEQDYEASWQVNIKDYGKYGCCDWSAFFKCEVIGNIHDNPELLEDN